MTSMRGCTQQGSSGNHYERPLKLPLDALFGHLPEDMTEEEQATLKSSPMFA